MKSRHKHEAHLIFLFFWKCMHYHLHIHILINTRTYYPYRIRSVHFSVGGISHSVAQNIPANIPIITPHTHIHTHSNTYALYAQRYFISKCFLKLNSVNVRIFINLKHQVYGTSKYINHSIWHTKVPKWHINVAKLLQMACQCTQITPNGTPMYPNYSKWHTNVPKLLQMVRQCTQITAHGKSVYPNQELPSFLC
jgi:hypothetical protein